MAVTSLVVIAGAIALYLVALRIIIGACRMAAWVDRETERAFREEARGDENENE
jgi:hypothetical protein